MTGVVTNLALHKEIADDGSKALYERYREFVGYVYNHDPAMCRTYSEFVDWWASLPAAVQAVTRAKYEKGHALARKAKSL